MKAKLPPLTCEHLTRTITPGSLQGLRYIPPMTHFPTSSPLSTDPFEKELLGLQDNLFSFALSLTADQTKAEDLMQDTTLKVLVNKDKYRTDTNFKGWVFTVMRNLFINDYHRTARTRNIFDTNADIAFVGTVDETEGLPSPDQEMTLKEINGAINSLSDEYKLPFSMYVSGYKYKEIAETLDLPIGTVKSRIFFARKKLQSNLKDFR